MQIYIKPHNLTRKEFAENLSISYSTFRSWQYNQRSVEVVTAYQIATALGVSLEYLITGAAGEKEKKLKIELKDTVGEMYKLAGKLEAKIRKLA
jgi:transcriptional regulator with XRE-family HTH domain